MIGIARVKTAGPRRVTSGRSASREDCRGRQASLAALGADKLILFDSGLLRPQRLPTETDSYVERPWENGEVGGLPVVLLDGTFELQLLSGEPDEFDSILSELIEDELPAFAEAGGSAQRAVPPA